MARIAEDLLLLLLDNPSAQPALDPARRQRVLAAAVLLDLAWACRIRPAVAGDPAPAGHLIALAGGGPLDAVTGPAFELLARRPLGPAAVVRRLRRRVPDALHAQLEAAGLVRRIRLPGNRFRPEYGWPLADRSRPAAARAAVVAALFDGRNPDPATAAIIALLHAVDGLGVLLDLNDRGWRWVHARATEIGNGTWVSDAPQAVGERNLAVTAAALRPALA